MRANAATMLAALAAKSDEQDRRIAALEAAASGNDALPPDCDPGRPRPPIGAKAYARARRAH